MLIQYFIDNFVFILILFDAYSVELQFTTIYVFKLGGEERNRLTQLIVLCLQWFGGTGVTVVCLSWWSQRGTSPDTEVGSVWRRLVIVRAIMQIVLRSGERRNGVSPKCRDSHNGHWYLHSRDAIFFLSRYRSK
jgi:hypothetical protein